MKCHIKKSGIQQITTLFCAKCSFCSSFIAGRLNQIRRFKDGNAVLEENEIDGKKLIGLIPFIDDCEPF